MEDLSAKEAKIAMPLVKKLAENRQRALSSALALVMIALKECTPEQVMQVSNCFNEEIEKHLFKDEQSQPDGLTGVCLN